MKPKLLFIVGPTASGKSQLALQIAQTLRLPIANADSVQVYKSVDIGTAKPSHEELQLVPHYLLSYVDEGEEHTAGDYRRTAVDLIQRMPQPLLFVGGSGFYLQALEKGMFDVPKGSTEMRAQVEQDADEIGGLAKLYHELQGVDPDVAARISPQDRYRILRALEVIRTTGRRLSEIEQEFKQKSSDYEILKIGLSGSRQVLRERVQKRAQNMLERGLLQEVQDLRAKGLSAWAPMQSVGYKECQEYLAGQLQKEELLSQIITSTMQLAKKQMTWFRRDSHIHWVDFENIPMDPLLEKIKKFLEDKAELDRP